MALMVCLVALIAVLDCLWELCSKTRSGYNNYLWLPIVTMMVWVGTAFLACFASTTFMVLVALTILATLFNLLTVFVFNPAMLNFVMEFAINKPCEVSAIIRGFSIRSLWINGLMMGLMMAVCLGIH